MDEATLTQQYYIATKSAPTDDRARVLKYGSMFAVFDRLGDISDQGLGEQGIYYQGTRYLSEMTLRLWGERALLLSSTIEPNNFLFTADLANLDVSRGDSVAIHRGTLHLLRSRFLWRGVAYEELEFVNYGMEPLDVPLSIFFAADFADIFEVRGTPRERRGRHLKEEVNHNSIILGYEGLDDVTRKMRITCEPSPDRIAGPEMRFELELKPKQVRKFHIRMECDTGATIHNLSYPQARDRAFSEMKSSAEMFPRIHSSNSRFNDWMNRSFADVQMMTIGNREKDFPYAGVPWFSTVFGRDGIITGLQMLWIDPRIAHGVLKRLAFYQAKSVDPRADAEPGKILHEMRGGEMAALHEVPFEQYYGSVDATPLFVLLAGLYVERTGDEATLNELWPSIEAALNWIDGAGDPDGDGFIEYQRASEQGLANQGWKDSYDAIFHADGRLAEGYIALAEVQGYVFAAKQLAARCALRLGKTEKARQLEAEAAQLAERFEQAFWCEDLGTYALALDGAKRPCRVRSSNAGQLLFTGIAREDRARKVATDLLRPHFFTGWGIRTIARGEARYNPMSYHDGSIWPHDNALIALGFARYGLKHSVAHLFKGLFEAATYMDLRRLPELFCGFRREKGRGPTLYPVACAPQAWASATPFTLLEAALGLEFDSQRGEIRLRNPRLPSFLNEVVLRELQLGPSSVDLRVRRHGDEVSLEVLNTRGRIQVSIVMAH